MGNWLFRQMMHMQVFFFRLSNGRIMSSMRGMPLLILTTIGRKSGKVRETPIMYMRDGKHFVVFASNAGRDSQPGWYVNLRAHPQATIEIPGTRLRVDARLYGNRWIRVAVDDVVLPDGRLEPGGCERTSSFGHSRRRSGDVLREQSALWHSRRTFV